MGGGLSMILNESTPAEETNSPLADSWEGFFLSPCSTSIMDGQSVSNHLSYAPSKKNGMGSNKQ